MSFFILIVLLLNKRKKYITEQRNLDLNYVVLIIFSITIQTAHYI